MKSVINMTIEMNYHRILIQINNFIIKQNHETNYV